MDVINAVEILEYATLLRKENLVVQTENEWLKRALSDIEDMCVEFHECGPYIENEEVKRVLRIYDVAHQALEESRDIKNETLND